MYYNVLSSLEGSMPSAVASFYWWDTEISSFVMKLSPFYISDINETKGNCDNFGRRRLIIYFDWEFLLYFFLKKLVWSWKKINSIMTIMIFQLIEVYELKPNGIVYKYLINGLNFKLVYKKIDLSCKTCHLNC